MADRHQFKQGSRKRRCEGDLYKTEYKRQRRVGYYDKKGNLNHGHGRSRFEKGISNFRGFGPDGRGRGRAMNGNFRGYDPDGRDPSRTMNGSFRGFGQDGRGRGRVMNGNFRGFGPDGRGRGRAMNGNFRGDDPDERDPSRAMNGNFRSYDPDGRGPSRGMNGDFRGYDPDGHGPSRGMNGDFRGYDPDGRGPSRAMNGDFTGYDPDRHGPSGAKNADFRGYDPDGRGPSRTMNGNFRGFGPDGRGRGRAMNGNLRGFGPDGRGRGRAMNGNFRGDDPDGRGRGRAMNGNLRGYDPDGRDPSRTMNGNFRGFGPDGRGRGRAMNGNFRGYDPDGRGRRAPKRDFRGYGPNRRDRAVSGDFRGYWSDEHENRDDMDENRHEERAQGENQRRECMANKLLEDIELANPEEILMAISHKPNEFWSLLNNKAHTLDDVHVILSVIATACKSKRTPETLCEFLRNLKESSFFSQTVLQYITGLILEKPSAKQSQYFEPLKNLVCIINSLVDWTPAPYVRILPVISTLKFVAQTMHSASGAAEVNEKLTDIIRQQKAHGPQELCRSSEFRKIPVFPTSDDLHLAKPPDLRPNKTRGKYESITEYLEVQFRLLREDFVGPLRDGLNDYLKPKTPSSDCRKPNQIRVYHRVHVLNPICTPTGLAYRICFDVARLRNVRWEATKRLIFGSLVCLSKDNFKTLLFATVSDRHPKRLKDGEVTVVFQDNNQVSGIAPDETFSMIESSAYFEAYRHVLTGLQTITDGSFPFHKYLVSCECEVAEPRYLQGADAVYDIQCLNGEHKAVPIFEDREWPSVASLDLDASQLDALKAALTREFTVIQGPPGTGKTFLGLKIVSTLLDNKHIWFNPDEGNSPILLVCYTNHALDQFLEGIQKYCPEKMVRAGSRSESKILEQYCLGNLRKVIREKRQVSQSIFEDRRKTHQNMSRLKNKIQKDSALIKASERGVLHEDVLEPFIEKDHLTALKKRTLGAAHQHSINKDKPSALLEWLKVHELISATDTGSKHPNADVHTLATDVEYFADAFSQSRISDRDIWTGYTNDELQDASVREQEHETAGERTLAVNFDDFFRTNRKPSQMGQEQDCHKAKAIERVRSGDRMTRDDLRAVKDVWNLSVPKRWRLYRYWLNEYRRQLRQGIQQFEEEYQQSAERLTEVLNQEDMAIMKEAAVIGMTTTAAARYRLTLQEIRPKIIVIEEAAEVLEAHIVTTLSAGCEHLILIGDHKQLRPSPNVYKLAERFNLKISLFERMVENGIPFKSLRKQHRMRPEISRLLEHIYPGLENHPSVGNYENVRGVAKNVFFVRHQQAEDTIVDMNTYYNVHEAEFVTALCRYLLQQGYKPHQITILTLYTGQLIHLRKYLSKTVFQGVRATAVDNFQGEENDIILLSLVRSNSENNIGFLKEDNRVCVALSRAKVGFFAIGNLDLLAKKSDLWNRLVTTLEEMGCIGGSLKLSCQNHPNIAPALVAFAKEFAKVPEGGCESLCGVRLPCGHVCERVCHTNHNKYKCRKNCNRNLCESKHSCPKLCYEDCGSCDVQLEKKIPSCGHTQLISCHQSPETFKCLYDYNTMLRCGHRYKGPCGEKDNYKCTEIIHEVLKCGHAVNIECRRKKKNISCQEKCNVALDCGHACPGNCASCFGGRLHAGCKSNCGRNLVCRHGCLDKCSKNCPPCSEKCENICGHSYCPKRCGEPCAQCNEPCLWQCEHFKCTLLCHQLCDRPRCDDPCKKLLPCKHPCIGLCGETCPDKCRICDKDEVEEFLFGTEEAEEDEPLPRFVQLEDCGHVLEVEGLDHWMSESASHPQEATSVQLKACPKCRTVIRRTLRYGSQVKQMLKDIEQVKELVLGRRDEVEVEKRRVETKISFLLDFGAALNLREKLSYAYITLEDVETVAKASLFIKHIDGLNRKIEQSLEHFEGNDRVRASVTAITNDLEAVRRWVLQQSKRFSEQELREGSQEIDRLSFFWQARILEAKMGPVMEHAKATTKAELRELLRLLTDNTPLTPERRKDARTKLEHIKLEIPAEGLGVTEVERDQIIKAVGLTKGHWFKCPNGHFYAIGECGGATEKSTCPECGSAIGGAQHQLLADNALATEVDGATYAAWSDQANMANYVFDELQ